MNNTNANTNLNNVSNTILLPTEDINGWIYYKSPYDNSYVFGIEANPSGVGANTNTIAIEVTASSLDCSSDGVFYKTSNQEGIFASQDFFNTKITSSTKPNGWVNIRWFLDPLTLTNLNTVSQNFATSTGANYTSPVLWLKKINSKLRLIDNLRPDGLGLYYGTEPMQQNGIGTENGQNYYEFKQVSNIDGTGGAAFKRVSNIVESNSLYTIPSGMPGVTRTIRYNTLTQTFEGYDGNNWAPLH